MSEIISKATIKRLINDIKQLDDDPLQNIFYRHHQSNMLEGAALIIGPSDTPYAGGYYLFHFKFPTDYPHSPPIVKYKTNDGLTRMHPNLYKSGKVCLSILNTWPGEPWTGCQTISSVLLTIQSILTNNPLLHEPGITSTHSDFKKYSEIIRFKNISLSMLSIVNNSINLSDDYDDLLNIAKKDFIKNFDSKITIYNDSLNKWNLFNASSNLIETNIYKISCKINYTSINELMYLIKEKLLLIDII